MLFAAMANEHTLIKTVFSSNDQAIIQKKIESVILKDIDVATYFDVEHCIHFLCNNGYERVALQFPDELLPYAFEVTSAIKKGCNKYVFVLGDTSYGSCCVDETAAEHLNADCIIHFGRSCLSQPSRLPTLFIFGKENIDISDCVNKLKDILKDKDLHCVLFYDVIFSYLTDTIYATLRSEFPNILLSNLCLDRSQIFKPSRVPETSNKLEKICSGESKESCCNCGSTSSKARPSVSNEHFHSSDVEQESIQCRFRRFVQFPTTKSFEDYAIVYIGDEDIVLRNLMMSFNKSQFYTYNPYTKVARQETLSVNRALMKRYYLIQKAKEANVVGIVIGTLGVANYLHILDRVKKLLKQVDKKYYTFVVGKLNTPKLANFMEIDIFVLIACPQCSLIDSQDFYKPIVTPYELEIACLRTREWTGDYITDFTALLPGSSHHIDLDDEVKDDEPEYSLLTGKLLSHSSEKEDHKISDAIAEKNKDSKLAVFGENNAASFLASRSWQGLEKNINVPVEAAKEGRSGIAAGYTHETHSET